MASLKFTSGDETRTFTYDQDPDGTAHVSQRSEGGITRFAFGSEGHVVTITFRPGGGYSIDDVRGTLMAHSPDPLIDDVEAELVARGIVYETTEGDGTLTP
jgi:hypothetical protein